MDRSSLHLDEDQDSLFGSPPPSPARGRSSSQETFGARVTHPTIAIPGTGMGRENVGTIALPGSHMSCAELPADLPAWSLSLPRSTSSRDSSSVPPHGTAGTPTSLHSPVVRSRSSSRSVPSRISSAASAPSIVSASTRKRRTPQSKSSTPISPTPPIALPGPNEPTPPNFLRSQSSLLGLAGLVGCVKPAQLYTHNAPQSTSVQQSCSRSPTRGSTPTHPIVLDDDQDTPYIGKHPYDQPQVPQHQDYLDPETLRSNIMTSLTKEKNLFPVLESLIKLLGGEPHLPPSNPPPQSFTRPYGHDTFNMQSSSFVTPLPTSRISTAPPPKRRKLKHVPAGAVDWDVPFPFADGEGPEAYRDTWARDRAKQLVTQLLELVQNAVKRGAIKTAKRGGMGPKGRSRARQSQSSRSTSVETQTGQVDSLQAHVSESSVHINPSAEVVITGMPTDDLVEHSSLLETPSMLHSPNSTSRDRMSLDSESAIEEGSVVSSDYSGFEEWLFQLQQFVPLGTNVSASEPDSSIRSSALLNSSASGQAINIHVPAQDTIQDEAIDPVLPGISQQVRLTSQSQLPTSSSFTIVTGDTSQALDIFAIPPALTHSPRTSLSSLTEPPTPVSDAFVDVPTSTVIHQDPARDPAADQPVEKDRPSLVRAAVPSSSTTEHPELHRVAAAQKGKARGDEGSVASATPSTSSKFTPSAVSTLGGTLDKRAILERARERRRQLVAEIERTKLELWETAIENAVLVHFIRDGSS